VTWQDRTEEDEARVRELEKTSRKEKERADRTETELTSLKVIRAALGYIDDVMLLLLIEDEDEDDNMVLCKIGHV
jgi:hypothetical protein